MKAGDLGRGGRGLPGSRAGGHGAGEKAASTGPFHSEG